MPLEDYPPMVRPFRVLDERLQYHSVKNSGRLLDGLKYDFEGTHEVRGARDFPYLQPVAYSDFETIGPGANIAQAGGSQPASQGASPAWDEQTFSFWIWARKQYGFYQRDPAGTAFGVMDWVAKVRDAVERDVGVDQTIDPRMNKTAVVPVQSLIGQNEVTELGWGVLVEFVIKTDTYCPGGRFAAS